MAFTSYSSEQILEFKKKDLVVTKIAIIKSWVEKNGVLPPAEILQKGVDMCYEITEIDKKHLNPNYIPNTEDGQPFVGNEFSKNRGTKNKVNPEDLVDK
jgi:hypothetical protein